ncbi:hypothetical protein Anas_12019 [Armadillidium nasatum]|uniref:Uncharacterized protein n=1 Tax=Armadillidium nasatum TaxID=96803 RepID=A0A5N5T774_9CRUS|nr:hypothetical protein Anas_12019 [Armadillidium nasatum]
MLSLMYFASPFGKNKKRRGKNVIGCCQVHRHSYAVKSAQFLVHLRGNPQDQALLLRDVRHRLPLLCLHLLLCLPVLIIKILRVMKTHVPCVKEKGRQCSAMDVEFFFTVLV